MRHGTHHGARHRREPARATRDLAVEDLCSDLFRRHDELKDPLRDWFERLASSDDRRFIVAWLERGQVHAIMPRYDSISTAYPLICIIALNDFCELFF